MKNDIDDDLKYFQDKLLKVFKCNDTADPDKTLKYLDMLEKRYNDGKDISMYLSQAFRTIRQYATLKKYG